MNKFQGSKGFKHQPHEGEMAGKSVDELRIRLIRGEQATLSIRDRWKVPPKSSSSTVSANDNEEHFSRDMLIVPHGKKRWFLLSKTNAVCEILLLIIVYKLLIN